MIKPIYNIEQLNYSYLVTDTHYNIIRHNQHFEQIFIQNNANKNIANLASILKDLDKIKVKQSCLTVNNNTINKTPMLSYYYCTFSHNNNNTYTIQIINWLNWLHNLYQSMDIGYHKILALTDNNTILPTTSSDIHSFNGLLPLLMHNPSSHIHKIKPSAFHAILRKFMNRKNSEHMSKYYAQYTYKRLTTSIREQTGCFLMEVAELMKHRDILNFRYNGEIYIPNTIIKQDLLINDFHDPFLSFYLSSLLSTSSNSSTPVFLSEENN
jgi:hypothetical protein